MTKSKPKGPSALKSLKNSLKNAGLIGPKPKRVAKSKVNKLSEAASAKREVREKLKKFNATSGSNPFELKFTKQKHEVLGRKLKGVKGKPGVTRKRAEETVSKLYYIIFFGLTIFFVSVLFILGFIYIVFLIFAFFLS